MTSESQNNRRGTPRKTRTGKIGFNILNNPVEAKSANYSDTGICFNDAPPLEVETSLGKKGKTVMRGRLIWAKRQPNGQFAYGFEFIAEDGSVQTNIEQSS
jgi:hypothetical protein